MEEGNRSAVETNVQFREHDIEFLQKRTKLWLETVLGEKYGERTLPELVSDGNLLYRISKHLTREMTGASPGSQEMFPQTLFQVSLCAKNSGKYLPYANVDTFLKTCREVGLTDVELFTPPDAVEGKDIRRVCTSIRSLARKARFRHIRVPDFEDINRPLPMPKEKIGEIKENLQHSQGNMVTPAVATPEADIVKSERVQIISRFLSATTNPLYVPEEECVARSPSEPCKPGPWESLSTDASALSTRPATIGSIHTPTRTKSASVIEASSVDVKGVESSFASTPQLMSSGELKPEKLLMTPFTSPAMPVDQSNSSPLTYSGKALGSFRHVQPLSVKETSFQSKVADLADMYLVDGSSSNPKSEEMPWSAAVSKPAVPTVLAPSMSSDPTGERIRELPSLAKLGLGAYRHAQPHFSFKKSSQPDLIGSPQGSEDFLSKSLEAEPETNALKAYHMKAKAPSSNKIVEKDPRSKLSQTAAKPGQESTVPAKELIKKRETKAPGMQMNPRLWVPLAASALAFVGTLLLLRSREPAVYEVKQGDTLSKISKQVGKKNWDELVKLNPKISNPDLIYPSDRLKLPS